MGYFQKNPDRVRMEYTFLGTVMFFIALFTAWFLQNYLIFAFILFLPFILFLFGINIITTFYALFIGAMMFTMIVDEYKDSSIISGVISALNDPSIGVPLGLVLAGAIISFIGLHMPRKTEKGVEMYKRVLGFKEFIKRVEEDRLKRMMEEDPTKIERIIPYAIVLGIENIWIEKIGNVLNYKPSWIETLTRDTGIDIGNLFKWW
jgi:hypothetical protein